MTYVQARAYKFINYSNSVAAFDQLDHLHQSKRAQSREIMDAALRNHGDENALSLAIAQVMPFLRIDHEQIQELHSHDLLIRSFFAN